jgi:hypothetical protein
MAVYNGERYLHSAIDSVLGQTRGDFELLIVDDGSTDATPKILSGYAREDERLTIRRVAHAGRSAALNFGIRTARAELIARLDADDRALPERLDRQLAFLEANAEIALLGGAALLIDERGQVFRRVKLPRSHDEIVEALERYSAFIHSNVVFRREAVEAVGGYRPAFEPSEDYDLWLRLTERHPTANLAEFVGEYRYYPDQESVVLAEAQALCAVAARASARYRRDGGPDPFDAVERIDSDALIAAGVDRAELTEAVVRYALWLADTLSRAGRPDTASALLRLAASRAEGPSAPPMLGEEVRRQAAAIATGDEGPANRTTSSGSSPV